MDKFRVLAASAMVLLFCGMLAVPATSQTVNVTFTVNTSTNPDTLGENGVVQIRGALNGQTGAVLPGGKTIDWNSASELIMDNTGGDYWQLTVELTPDDTLKYKYWAGFSLETGTQSDWESGINNTNGIEADNNRVFIAGASDTTIDLEYFNGTGQQQDQFWRPFETKADSVAIYFRVNLGGVTEAGKFDPTVNGPVGVRGNDQTSGGVIDWGATKVLLSREETSVNEGSFWSGVAYVPKDSVTTDSKQSYKFFIENNGGIDWEGSVNPDDVDGNRTFFYSAPMVARMDTTLHWVYFDNEFPVGMNPVESQVTFRASTEALEGIGLFDRGVGDEIKVIGAKGWDRPNDFIDMTFIPALQEWATTEPFTVIPGSDVFYKYFVVWDSSRVDSTSPNFIPGLTLDDGWEEPSAAGGGNRSFAFQNAATQSPSGDFGFDRQFYASVPQNAWFANDVAVTFNVNMANAMDMTQNTNPLFNPATDEVWIQMDGSLLALQQGFAVGGEDARVVQLTDTDGDMVYSGTWQITGPGWYQLGFQVAYGNATSGFITNGGGFDFGRRYYQFIKPTNVNQDGSTTWPTEENLNVVDWVETNLPVEAPPDLTQATSVSGPRENLPNTFALNANYPNPFNPTTNIEYSIASSSEVKIQVFNLVGQLVNTLVNETQKAGRYLVTWNGNNARGQSVSSGVYFIKMKAGDFNRVRKMTLLK